MSDIINIASQCLRDEAQAVLDQIPLLDDNFERAVKLILDCKGKLIVTGVGKSGHSRRQDGGYAFKYRNPELLFESP